MTLKIAEVEKCVLTVEEAMSTNISPIENSMANIREQIKSEIEHFIKIKPSPLRLIGLPVRASYALRRSCLMPSKVFQDVLLTSDNLHKSVQLGQLTFY